MKLSSRALSSSLLLLSLACNADPVGPVSPQADAGHLLPGDGGVAQAMSDAGSSSSSSGSDAGAQPEPAEPLSDEVLLAERCALSGSNHREGTRLIGRYLTTAEGDRSWRGWFDTELGVSCAFERASDGSFRCLPSESQPRASTFLDASCAEQVVPFPGQGCGASDPYVLEPSWDDCGVSSTRVYALGEPVTPAELYSRVSESSCEPNTTSTSFSYRRIGAELSPELFVSARLIETAASRIVTHEFLGDDGTRQVIGWTDTELGTDCIFDTAVDGVIRCVPRAALARWNPTLYSLTPSGLFSDQVCGAELRRDEPTCDEAKRRPYAELRAENGCYATVDFGLPRAYSGSIYAENADDLSCSAAAPETASGLYEIVRVPTATFAPTRPLVRDTDEGRLQPRYLATDDGACSFRDWYDVDRGETCDFEPLTDGIDHCVPESLEVASLGTAFLDSACEQALSLGVGPSGCIPPVRYAATFVSTACSRQRQLYPIQRVLAAADLPPLWAFVEGACSPWVPTEPQYLVLGEPLDPAVFMPATLETPP